MAQRNPEFAERLFTSDVDIDGHPALKVSELVSLIRVYNFSEIIQIAREVDHTSWKLFIETVSPIYNLSSFFSK